MDHPSAPFSRKYKKEHDPRGQPSHTSKAAWAVITRSGQPHALWTRTPL